MRLTIVVENGLSAGLSLDLGHDSVSLVGRAPDATLRLAAGEVSVSRQHCILEVVAGTVTVKNLQKSSRTTVNGKRVDAPTMLQPGDRLAVGRVVLRLHAGEPPSLGESESTQNLTLADLEEVPAMPAHASLSDLVQPNLRNAADDHARPAPRAMGCDLCGVIDPGLVDPDYASSPWLCGPCRDKRRSDPNPRERRIGRYEIFGKTGEGGMGAVYEGIDVDSAVRVAVKVLRTDREPTQKEIQRFVREQGIAITLRHPNIVRCFQVGMHDGVLFMASEFVSGGEASTLIRKATAEEILRVGVDLFRALGYAHDQGVVHRDVKPANLLVTDPRDRVRRGRLMDFGLAKNVREMNRGLTGRGEAGGTLSLMAPEQLLDFSFANPSADLYAAAATLFRLLTGTDAIVVPGDPAEANIATIAAAVLATPRRPLHALRAELPTPLCRYIDALLARDASVRAGLRAGEVADALAEWTARMG